MGMDRRSFLIITGGVLTALREVPGSGAPAPQRADAELLEAGLNAMARAPGWFEAHWGAALIAGSYLLAETGLAPETRNAIRTELEVLRRTNEEACKPFARAPVEPDALASLRASLLPALEGGLRQSGHAVIYTALATRALGAAPELATADILEPICRWNRAIARVRPKQALEAEEYRDEHELVATTLEAIVRFEPLVGYPEVQRPNFTHWITHTEALRRLKTAGYADVWALGCAGHRAHITAEVPEAPSIDRLERSSVDFEGIQSAAYWNEPARRAEWHRPWHRRKNPNGDWIASGHLFKVLYAFHELARAAPDGDLVERAARVVFERYFDPGVQGG